MQNVFCDFRSLPRAKLQCACSYRTKGENSYTIPDWLPEHNDGKEYTPSYNIARTDVTPILVSNSKYKNAAKTSRVLKPMVWGIIPPWHKVLLLIYIRMLLHK